MSSNPIDAPTADTAWMTQSSHPASRTEYQEATTGAGTWARVIVDGHEVTSPSLDTDAAYRQYRGRVNRAIDAYEAQRDAYEDYARWAVGPLMTRDEWTERNRRIAEQAAAGTLSNNPYEWGVDMDAVRAATATRVQRDA